MMLLLERGQAARGRGRCCRTCCRAGRQNPGRWEEGGGGAQRGQRGRSPDSPGRGARSGPRRPLPGDTHHAGGPSRSAKPSAEHHIQHQRECAGHRTSQTCPVGAHGPSGDPAYPGDQELRPHRGGMGAAVQRGVHALRERACWWPRPRPRRARQPRKGRSQPFLEAGPAAEIQRPRRFPSSPGVDRKPAGP